jgi:cardiolipin synthase
VDLINRTKRRLWIASPYFVPDEQFITALKLAALRGVEVRVLMPDQTDNFLVQYTGWSYLDELAGAGIQVWRHQKGFMHQKVIVADDVCTIGTANFDNRSFRLNFEITLEIADAAFTGQVAAMLENDFTHAVRAQPADLEARGRGFRFLTRACRLLAPIQ